MLIETKKDIYGRDFNFMRLGLVKGRNLLSSKGFTQCENPTYYYKDGEYWHYNSMMKVWLQDFKKDYVKISTGFLIEA